MTPSSNNLIDFQNVLAKYIDSEKIKPDKEGKIDIQNFPSEVQELILEHMMQNNSELLNSEEKLNRTDKV
jgi:hypothetical protein